MSNALLLHCKETHKQSIETIAAALNMTPAQYKEIERGEVLITYEQAEQLAKHFGGSPGSFYSAALQLDTLLAQREIMKVLKWANGELKDKIEKMNKATAAKKAKKRKTTPSR